MLNGINPMLQYITAGCCDDEDHIANRVRKGFAAKLRSDLDSVKHNLKMFLHTLGHHQCWVMDPIHDLKDMVSDQICGSDPTKPTTEVFTRIAKQFWQHRGQNTGKEAGPLCPCLCRAGKET
jgi:hypothetical protein